MRTNTLAIVGATAALMSAPGLALAGDDVFDDTLSSCTGNNCSSLRLPGSVLAFGPSANTWTTNAFANAGECVRFDLISPPHPSPDMEIIVVAPNGLVFRNDDRNGALDRRPLVKIASAPNNGWYRVVVTQFSGSPTQTNTVMLYARYSAGNPNCNNSTTPSAADVADELAVESAKTDRPAPAPKAGQPGSNQ